MAYSSHLEISIGTGSAGRELVRFRDQLERTDRKGQSLVSAMGGVGRVVGIVAGALGGLSFGRVISESAAFEDSMLGLQAVSGATAKQIEELQKQARTLGATSMFSARQAGDAQRYLAQAGFEVNEILEATPGLLNLAAAGQMDLGHAADIASNALGGFKLEVSELDRVVDVMAATAAGANTSIQQLGEAMSYAAPFAAAAGISIEETSAAIGAMSDAGIQASRAGTGLIGIIRELSRITPSTAKGLESAGIALSDVDISTRGLLPVLETLNKSSINVTQAIEIFGSEAGAAALNVIEASDSVSAFATRLNDVEGEASRMALVIGSGLTGSMRGFNSMMSESILQLGESGLAGGFKSVTDTATGVLAVYNGLLPELAEANNLTETQVSRIEALAGGIGILKDAVIIASGVYGARFVSAMAAGTASTIGKTQASIASSKATASATAAEVSFLRSVQGSLSAQLASTTSAAQKASLRSQLAANTRALTVTNNAYAESLSRSTLAARAMEGASRAAAGALALVGGPLGAAIIAGSAMYYFRDSLGFASAEARETRQEIDQLVGSIEGLTHAQYQNQWRSLYDGAADARAEVEKLQKQIESLQESAGQESVMYQGRGGAASSQITRLQADLQEQLRVLGAAEEGLRKYEQAWEDFQKSQITGASIFRTLDQWLFDTGESAQRTSREFSALSYALGTGGEGWDDYIGKLRGARDVLGMTADEAAAYAAQQQGFTGVYADMAAAVAGQTDALESYRQAIAAGNAEEASAHLERARRFAEAEAMVQAQLLNMETLTSLLKGVQTELSAVALTSALTVADAGGAGAAYVANAIKALNERASAIQRTTTVTETNTAASREAAKAERELANAERERQRVLNDSISAYSDLFQQLSPAGAATAEYNETVARLTVAYEDGTKSALEYYAAIGQAAKNYNEAVKAADPNIKRVEQLTQQYDRQYQRGVALTQAIDDINAAYRRGDIDGQQYGRMIQGVRDEMAELALEADPMAQEMARAWEEAANRIDETFSDAFAGAFDSFDSFADQLLDGFKRLLAELAYQATLKPIVVAFTGDMQGMMGGAGGFDFGSTISAAKGLFGLGGSTANAASLGMQGGVSGTAITSANQVAAGSTGWMSSAASMAGPIAAMYGLASMGNSLFEGAGLYDALGIKTGGRSSEFLGQIAPIGGTIAGAVLDSLGIGGQKTKFSGRFGTTGTNDPSQYANSGKDGVFEHQDSGANFYGQSALGFTGFLDRGTERLQRAGQGEGKGWAEELTNAAVEMDNLVASLAQTGPELTAMQAAVQGLETSSRSASEIVEFALNERPRAALEALGGHFGEFVRGLEGGIEEVVQQAQLGQQAHSLMAASMERLNLQFDTTTASSYNAASQMAQYAGGIENLAAVNDAYYQAAFSENERLSNSQQDLFSSLSSLTNEVPRTVEELRAMVEAQNLNSESSAQLAYDLRALAPALAESNRAVKEAIEQQYQSALGRAADAEGLQYWFNTVSSGSNSLSDALGFIANSAEAAEYAANGASSSIEGMADALRMQDQLNKQLLQAQGNTNALRQLEIDRLKEMENAEVDNLAAIQRRIWAIEDEQAAQQEAERIQQERIRAIEQEANAMDQARQQLANFGVSINDWFNNLQGTEQGLGTPADQLAATAQAFDEQYAKAASGDQAARSSITQYADRFIEAQKAWSASGDQTISTIDRVSSMMEKLPDQLTPEQFLADEFKNALSEQTRSLESALNGIPRNSAEDIAELLAPHFSAIDLDASGLINYSEFSKAFEGVATDETLQNLFGLLDKNGDGQLSYLEAIAASSNALVELGLMRQPGDTDDVLGGNPSAIDNIIDQNPVSDPIASKVNAAYHDVMGEDAKGFQLTSWAMWLDKKASRSGQLHQAVAWANLAMGGEDWLKERGLYGDGTVPQFSNGGYTGPGGKYDPAGIVHAGEVVWSQDDISRAGGVGAVESLRNGGGISMPPLPAFPLLDQNDQSQVMRDLLNENRKLRQELNARLDKIEKHGAAGVAVQQAGFKGQISEQRKSNAALEDMSAAARLEASR